MVGAGYRAAAGRFSRVGTCLEDLLGGTNDEIPFLDQPMMKVIGRVNAVGHADAANEVVRLRARGVLVQQRLDRTRDVLAVLAPLIFREALDAHRLSLLATIRNRLTTVQKASICTVGNSRSVRDSLRRALPFEQPGQNRSACRARRRGPAFQRSTSKS